MLPFGKSIGELKILYGAIANTSSLVLIFFESVDMTHTCHFVLSLERRRIFRKS